MTPSDSPSKDRRNASIKHVLYSEILSVTSAMRKNSRWASSTLYMNAKDTSALGTNLGLRISSPAHAVRVSARGSREAELMGNFQELKRVVKNISDFDNADLPVLLNPFFAILRSPLSTGPITSAALSALHSFFSCGLINPNSQHLDHALAELSSTVSHCKFETSDSSGDEVVLLKILTVIQDCLCGSVGAGLGDVEVCEMLETVLTTCCQMRLSELLRRSAENSMHSLVRTVFSKLHALDPVAEEAKLAAADDEVVEGEIKMTVPTQDTLVDVEPEEQGQEKPKEEGEEEKIAVETEPERTIERDIDQTQPLSTTSFTNRPAYGLPSILELLRVIINVLDPNDQQHTDSTRLVALGILNTAFEEAGTAIAEFPSLKVLVVDTGCRFLFQLARSENMSILQSTLRTISTIIVTTRKHLKLQQELFLAFTIDRLAIPLVGQNGRGKKSQFSSPRPGTPSGTPNPDDGKSDGEKVHAPTSKVHAPPARGEMRDLILETLNHMADQPSFMVDLYTNYDCDVNCENLFERLVDFLTNSVQSSNPNIPDLQQRNTQILCLELLLSFIQDMATRAEGVSEEWPSSFPLPESLLQAKSQKQLILSGVAMFNNKPKSGLAFLEENGIVYNDLSEEVSKAKSLASFLKGCTRLDKRLLGDYISKPDNIEILKAFIGLSDFKNKDIADAMRELLESFRLPGEAQQIARITETFASIYFASGPAEIKSEDAVYVLAYSVILLNTDLHNPQIRKRMSIEDYQKNLRGVNDGSDFSPEFLQNIYDSIRRREIVMPEEHTGQLGFEYAWKELLARSRNAGDFMICNTQLFDVQMFKSVWKSVISAVAHAFITFDDDYITQKAITGFRQCATLAGRFLLPDVFDYVVVSLSQATSLLSDSLPGNVPNYPVVDVEGQSITVSNLSVKFGTNFKGQLAAVVLFNIVNGNGNALREGWTQIFEMFQNLFLHSLLPTRMLQMEDFLGGVTMIPLRGSQPPRPQPRSDGGLLSALSSYLMTPYSTSSETLVPDATDSDVENTLCTIDCIASCRLEELYSQITQLNPEAMVAAIRALEALAHERTVAKLKLQSDDSSPGPDNRDYQLPYDPASVFLLETMVSIACQSPQYIDDLWPIVFEHLSALFSTPTQYSVLLIERAVVSLLRLCRILAQKSSLRDQIYISFDLLAGLPAVVSHSVGEQVVSGVSLIVQQHRHIIRSQTEWNVVFAMIRTTLPHPEAARLSFDLATALASEGPDQLVSLDNFPGLVTILDDFATAAGFATERRQQRGRRVEPLTSANSPIVERGKKAVDILAHLHRENLVPLLQASQVDHSHGTWRQYTLPLLMSLSRQSTSAAREIRHAAIGHLQRILLGPNLLLDENDQNQVEDVFNRVIFPLLDELLKPQTYQRDPLGIPETRLRACALLCKVFMHLEVREQVKTDFRVLWIQILDLLDRLMNIDRGDQLYEAVPESLKNVILVMNATGILVPPPEDREADTREDQQRTLWSATHERIERFLPRFLNDVIVPPPSQPVSIPATPIS
ncbi:Sec7-like domain is implicated in guanine nucleotide exchange function [Macrolepiota fuliginosa MF-IS2]|uniref:Sec7-like domain is implicated in guanine nucleotide exchange function n=1 Tax=Macrolepiota fuliginosa MF-IS2 TaxID=1400762 RepID=A0A9P5XNK8_9AGAR|nr:Sec7-like domain is implicated in guanine nucleotide exchange function [Macrolepiota fuliginosa MF-IS2]